MAGGEEVEVYGKYRMAAKPKAPWRRIPILGNLLPYWQGSKHEFVLTVRAIVPTQETQLKWALLFSVNSHTDGAVPVPPLQVDQVKTFPLEGKLLGYTGDTLLVVNKDFPDEDSFDPFTTLYAFHTTPKTWLFLTGAVAILTSALATLGAWLTS